MAGSGRPAPGDPPPRPPEHEFGPRFPESGLGSGTPLDPRPRTLADLLRGDRRVRARHRPADGHASGSHLPLPELGPSHRDPHRAAGGRGARGGLADVSPAHPVRPHRSPELRPRDGRLGQLHHHRLRLRERVGLGAVRPSASVGWRVADARRRIRPHPPGGVGGLRQARRLPGRTSSTTVDSSGSIAAAPSPAPRRTPTGPPEPWDSTRRSFRPATW